MLCPILFLSPFYKEDHGLGLSLVDENAASAHNNKLGRSILCNNKLGRSILCNSKLGRSILCNSISIKKWPYVLLEWFSVSLLLQKSMIKDYGYWMWRRGELKRHTIERL